LPRCDKSVDEVLASLDDVSDRTLLNDALRVFERERKRSAREQAPLLTDKMALSAQRNDDGKAAFELRDQLRAALNPLERRVCTLKVAGYKITQIAKIVGISTDKVSKALADIRVKLKAEFHDYFNRDERNTRFER